MQLMQDSQVHFHDDNVVAFRIKVCIDMNFSICQYMFEILEYKLDGGKIARVDLVGWPKWCSDSPDRMTMWNEETPVEY